MFKKSDGNAAIERYLYIEKEFLDYFLI